ncbi:MAG: DUF58 domain-containing protein [Spirochaetales bacterium]|nr:DUF58 domain-containing protein [Spirochaetales bacterium]
MIKSFLWPFPVYLVLFLTTSSPLLRTATGTLAGFYLCNALYLLILSRSITIKRRDTILRSYKGSPQKVELILENRSLLPLFSAILQDGGDHRILVHLRPRERKLISYQILPQERGEFTQGPASISIYGLIGNFHHRLVVGDKALLIVFPSLQKLSFRPSRGFPLGSLRSASFIDEDPTRFRSIREYIQGDELRRINWKVSAKARCLYCNEYETAMDSPLMLFLNVHPDSYPLKYRHVLMEQTISYGASLISEAAKQGQAVGLASKAYLRDVEEEICILPEGGAATALLDILARIAQGKEPPWDLFLRTASMLPYRAQAWYLGPDPLAHSTLLANAVVKRGSDFRMYLCHLSKDAEERLRAERVWVKSMEGESGAQP